MAEAVLKLPPLQLDEVVDWCLACREGPAAVARLLVLDALAETPGEWITRFLEAAPALLAKPKPVSRIVSSATGTWSLDLSSLRSWRGCWRNSKRASG